MGRPDLRPQRPQRAALTGDGNFVVRKNLGSMGWPDSKSKPPRILIVSRSRLVGNGAKMTARRSHGSTASSGQPTAADAEAPAKLPSSAGAWALPWQRHFQAYSVCPPA